LAADVAVAGAEDLPVEREVEHPADGEPGGGGHGGRHSQPGVEDPQHRDVHEQREHARGTDAHELPEPRAQGAESLAVDAGQNK
jgi:hypothetical protein